jgi:hypothetical protein
VTTAQCIAAVLAGATRTTGGPKPTHPALDPSPACPSPDRKAPGNRTVGDGAHHRTHHPGEDPTVSTTSSIEWTDTTWNPTTGCDRVSPGCDRCYALTMAKRLKAMGSAHYQRDGNPATSGPGFGVSVHPDAVNEPLRWRKPRRVFVNSMSDLFHKDIPDEYIAQVFAVMAATPQHTYQILTKRHGRMRLGAGDRGEIAVAQLFVVGRFASLRVAKHLHLP